jgi:hypothetical protein
MVQRKQKGSNVRYLTLLCAEQFKQFFQYGISMYSMAEYVGKPPLMVDGNLPLPPDISEALQPVQVARWFDGEYAISAIKKAVISPIVVSPGGRSSSTPAVLRGLVAFDYPEAHSHAHPSRDAALLIEKEGNAEAIVAARIGWKKRAYALKNGSVTSEFRTFPYSSVILEPGHSLTLFVRKWDAGGQEATEYNRENYGLRSTYEMLASLVLL